MTDYVERMHEAASSWEVRARRIHDSAWRIENVSTGAVMFFRCDTAKAAQAEADRLNREAMRAVLEPLVGALRQIEGEPTVYTDCTDTNMERVRGIARAALATLTEETSDAMA